MFHIVFHSFHSCSYFSLSLNAFQCVLPEGKLRSLAAFEVRSLSREILKILRKLEIRYYEGLGQYSRRPPVGHLSASSNLNNYYLLEASSPPNEPSPYQMLPHTNSYFH